MPLSFQPEYEIMSTKSKPQTSKKKTDRDLATFEELPDQTKELMKLKEQDEKTAGPEHVEITKKIEEVPKK